MMEYIHTCFKGIPVGLSFWTDGLAPVGSNKNIAPELQDLKMPAMKNME